MRKITISVFACLMAGAVLTSSCIGSFPLFNKTLNWNKNLSNKFVNELVFIVASPVYALFGVADLLVLNSIEFWSGKSPLAKVGHVENVWGQDGRQYAVKTLKDGYEITKPTGEKVLFTHDSSTDSWMLEVNGSETEIFRFNDDGTIRACLPDGRHIDVTPDEAGVYDLRMAVNDGMFFAAR
ncbi:MAG: DUF3332 domain-containing protein [Prevotella sp.]|nr:DUF3332 domain-containing protein [Prevotella sp.]